MGENLIVIGGGIGGLSTGIYGRTAGFEVDVFERHSVAGGECTGWDRKGCHIDNCIHWLTGRKPGTDLHDTWHEVGALTDETAYAPVDRFFSARLEGREATLWNDLERTERELVVLAPEDEREIRKLIAAVRAAECCEIPASKPLEMMTPFDYLRLGMRMRSMPKVMKDYGSIDLEQLAERFHDPLLKLLIGGYMPKEYAAYAFIVSYATMTSGNGKVPLGGSKELAQRMVKRLEERGGRLHLGCEVRRIIVESDRACGVELADGTVQRADAVVFAADMSLLYGSLIDEGLMPEPWRYAYEHRSEYPVMSGLQAALLVDADRAPSGTTLFACEPMRAGASWPSCLSVHPYEYEPSWAPEGKTVLQVNFAQSDADHEWWAALSHDEYEAAKVQVVDDFLQRVGREFPELEGRMEVLDCWTPLTYDRYCGTFRGSYMGFMTVPNAKALPCDGRVAGVDGLYLAGQWVTSPGGLPIAVTSGKFAIQRIQRDRRKRKA